MASSDMRRLQLDDREIILVGTAHISQASIDTVRAVIEEETPDCVCVELDAQRLQALRNSRHWESLNIYQVVKSGQAPFLLANLTLASFQKRMGLQTGVRPGAELAAAVECAEQQSIPVELVDRNIRTTLLRAWRKTGFWKKLNLASVMLASLFEEQKVSEEELERLRKSDTLTAMLEELGDLLPSVKGILVDERDTYMAHHIRSAPGRKVVAVVGAAHLNGIAQQIAAPVDVGHLAELDTIPPKSGFSRLAPWLIPAIVVALFAGGFLYGDTARLKEAAIAWVLANGLLSALGALIALGHPLTILTAFVAAPITSLNPTIGAGMVTGVVQAMIVAPKVGDLERVTDDLATLSGWWRNRTTRVLLVFFFSSLGSAIGTFVAFGWLKNLF